MFRFLASLFADSTAGTRATTFRPQLTGLEVRDTPAALATVAFDPQPEPPLATRTVTLAPSVPGPGFVPGVTRGVVVVGG